MVHIHIYTVANEKTKINLQTPNCGENKLKQVTPLIEGA